MLREKIEERLLRYVCDEYLRSFVITVASAMMTSLLSSLTVEDRIALITSVVDFSEARCFWVISLEK